jgi:hypothetical protein
VFTDLDEGEGIIVDLNTKKYYQLNETAKLIWKGIEQDKTLNQIIEEVISLYEVSPDHAARSVQRIVDSFQAHKLVSAR